jgi:hypothetical protein
VYKRITSYIYSYENGEKICNCGYCRFDIYDMQCKVYINIKVPERYTMGIAHIYLLAQDEYSRKPVKEMLGRTGGLNGSICYRQICSKTHMTATIGVNNIKGVLIYNGDSLKRAFYCNLAGEEINLLELEEEKSELIKFESEFDEDRIYDEDRVCNEDGVYEEKPYPIEMSADNPPEKNTKTQIQQINQINTQTVELTSRQNLKQNAADILGNAPDSTSIPQRTENSIPQSQLHSPQKWQELLFSKFPKVKIIFGGEVCEAIKMRPHDLVWFPRKYWRFSSNRFLLNGYYNCRCIMLIKGTADREGSYYLAVPGKNMVNEAIEARRQGFSEFVSGKGEDGFWCCKAGQ